LKILDFEALHTHQVEYRIVKFSGDRL